VKLHDIALQPLTGEVVRIDFHVSVSALHHSGDEFMGVECLVHAGENFLYRVVVTRRKPGHALGMDVEFTQPADSRQGAPKCFIDRVREIFIPGIVGALMGGTPSRTGHRQNHVIRTWCGRVSVA
jgi:hypothetical protein